MIKFRYQLPHQLSLSPFVAGDKCSGPCADGYRCPPSCKNLAKEIKKMHDDCHDYSDCYSNHCGFIYCETMAEEQVTSGERKNSFDFNYVDTWFATFTVQRYPETVESNPQKSSSAALPLDLFFHFTLGFQGLFFCNYNPSRKHLRTIEGIYSTRHISFSFVIQELIGRLIHEQCCNTRLQPFQSVIAFGQHLLSNWVIQHPLRA